MERSKFKIMYQVNCTTCNKSYNVNDNHYRMAQFRKSKFYCSNLCRNGTIEERFWSKVIISLSDECWPWTAGCRTKKGYGTIKVDSKHIDAHRFSWMMANNRYDLTSKDFICHKCDNPSCVNPSHLFLGNAQINAQDAYDKGRLIMPTTSRYKKGNKASNSVLSDQQVLDIRKGLSNGGSVGEVAKLFNISTYKVSDIRRGKSYMNVT